MSALATILILASAPATAEVPLITGPIVMKQSEIRAYNARLAPDHPNYIRCARDGETGSLVKAKRVCRTNQEWDRIDAAGNNVAREAVESMQKGWTSGKT
ncbi:MAG: hypothetical protein RL339_142 [Pseudomonadota bacterium]|jgi:hypothetical protein